MPFSPINFASISPIGRPSVANWAQYFSRGLEAGTQPAHLRREAEKEEIANKMAQTRSEYLPQNLQSDLALKKSKIAMQNLISQFFPQQMKTKMTLQSAQARKAIEEANQKEMIRRFMSSQFGKAAPGQLQPSHESIGVDQSAGESLQTGGVGHPLNEFSQQYFRKLIGLPSEFPSEKSSRVIEQSKQNIAERARQKMIHPTATTQAIQERLVGSSVPLIEGIEDFLEQPRLRGSITGEYNSRALALAEKLARVELFPGTEGSIEKAMRIIMPRPLETPKRHRERLEHEIMLGAPYIAESFKNKGRPVPAAVKKYLKMRANKKAQTSKNKTPITKVIGNKTYIRLSPGKWEIQ